MDEEYLKSFLKSNNLNVISIDIIESVEDFQEKEYSNILLFTNFKVRVNEYLKIEERKKIVTKWYDSI